MRLEETTSFSSRHRQIKDNEREARATGDERELEGPWEGTFAFLSPLRVHFPLNKKEAYGNKVAAF